MFIKVIAKNTHEEQVVRLINIDDIVLVGEEHQEPEYLYDENGNIAQTNAPTEKLYFVLFKNCGPVKLDQTNYDLVEKALIK